MFSGGATETTKMKVALLGDMKAGKSALLEQWKNANFSTEYHKTTAFSRSTKRIADNKRDVLLDIYDMSGDKKYEADMGSFLYKMDTVLIVWDITDQTSFNRAADYYKLAKASTPKHCKFIFVANKKDLAANRVVDAKTCSDFAANNGATFFEASALDGENVNALFADIYESPPVAKKSGKRLRHTPQAQSKKYQDLVTDALKKYHEDVVQRFQSKMLPLTVVPKKEVPVPAEPPPTPSRIAVLVDKAIPAFLKKKPDELPPEKPKVELDFYHLIEESALALYKQAQCAYFDKLVTAQNAQQFADFLAAAGSVLVAYANLKEKRTDEDEMDLGDTLIREMNVLTSAINETVGHSDFWRKVGGAILCILGILAVGLAVALVLATLNVISLPLIFGALVGFSMIEYGVAGTLVGGGLLALGGFFCHTAKQTGVSLAGEQLKATLFKDDEVQVLFEPRQMKQFGRFA
jgi:small GTP-binding protein